MERESNAAIARRAIACIDLTDLDDDCTTDDVERLCATATEFGTAAVCVWPDFVALASRIVAGSGARVATVINFPTGDERAHASAVLAARAVADGAHEIDVVLPYRAWLAGDMTRPAAVLDAVRGAIGPDVMLKVIIESGMLGDDDTVRVAARFAIAHGADMVKTSTGRADVSATPEAATAILDAIVEVRDVGDVGLKVSGGIRTFDQAAEFLALVDRRMGPGWATPERFRIGASGLLQALAAELD